MKKDVLISAILISKSSLPGEASVASKPAAFTAAFRVVSCKKSDHVDDGNDFDGEVDDGQGCQLQTLALTKIMVSFNKLRSVYTQYIGFDKDMIKG